MKPSFPIVKQASRLRLLVPVDSISLIYSTSRSGMYDIKHLGKSTVDWTLLRLSLMKAV